MQSLSSRIGSGAGQPSVRRRGLLVWRGLWGVRMSFIGISRFAATVAIFIATGLLLASQAVAQSSGRVDCGNGYYCPRDNACLLGGLCGRVVEAASGSVRTSTGQWCDPGARESKFTPGGCVPERYTECSKGFMCPPGTTCGAGGQCDGGPPATGPMCGNLQCMEGRICASTGKCMNTQLFQDCGNGSICSKWAACEHPKGCVYVSRERTKQIRR